MLETQNDLGKTLTPEERTRRTQELQQNFYKAHSTATNEIITDPQMRTRYHQLYLQYRGYDAFYDPMVQKKLALTDDQRQKFGQYNQEWHKSMGDLRRDYETDRDGVTKRFGEMRKRDQDRRRNAKNAKGRKTRLPCPFRAISLCERKTGESISVPPHNRYVVVGRLGKGQASAAGGLVEK